MPWPYKLTPEQEAYRIQRTIETRKAEHAALWPHERSERARKMIKARHAKEIAQFGKIQRPYIPLQMHKKPPKDQKGGKNGL